MSTELPEIVTLGNPRLARPSDPVEFDRMETVEFQNQLDLLHVGLEHHGANGIAAPQLGWFQRFFLMRNPADHSDLIYWINPEVSILDEEPVWYWEGCLSVPGLKAYVGRPRAISVEGFDRNAQPANWQLEDWGAHLFQHEFDHLDGILFPDRVVDPRHMVTATELARRDQWPDDWPCPGARDAPIRIVSPAS